MKRYLSPVFKNVVLIYISVFIFSNCQAFSNNDLIQYLPAIKDMPGWHTEGDPVLVQNENLYLIINGGADIYQEYGFSQAIFQTYCSENGKSVNIEIYQMLDDHAAYGMFGFKKGEDGEFINLGKQGWVESYYLNFWEGNFLVTLTGIGQDRNLINNVINFAQLIDKKIEFNSEFPGIISFLPREDLENNHIVYLKGHLSLYNQYAFSTRDIFAFQDAVMGVYDEYRIYLLQYSSRDDAELKYISAVSVLGSNDNYQEVSLKKSRFEFRDAQNNRFVIITMDRFIIIFQYQRKINLEKICSVLRKKINSDNTGKINIKKNDN